MNSKKKTASNTRNRNRHKDGRRLNRERRTNIFMLSVETEIISLSKTKPLEWKRYIDDIFSLWNADKKEIEDFIVLAKRHYLTIKFTAENSNKEVNFVDTAVYKG